MNQEGISRLNSSDENQKPSTAPGESLSMDDIKPGFQLDRYQLVSRIGAGGMGLIFKGIDTRLQRPVAIKLVSDRVKDEEVRKTIRNRFLNEARAAGGLSHPNLVQIYDFGEFRDLTYIVMEYIEGETLEDLLKAKGQLNTEELLKVTKAVSSGLAFAHKKGIVHRDVKPSNIILEAQSGVIKILDFGIAKFVDEDEMKLTSTGMVLGSTHYLSPEHITGKNIDGRSDIFSLGTVLYECATGQLPFRGSNSSSILYKIIHFDPQPISEFRQDLPTSYLNIISKCLKKNADERFQKCEEIEQEIGVVETSLVSDRHQSTSKTKRPPEAALRSYVIRESQILSILKTQNRLSAEQYGYVRSKPVVETLLREQFLSEDELTKLIADCLDLPWVPRGRLKAIRIMDTAIAVLPKESIRTFNILPFFKDEEKKVISILIDGCTDFQRDPKFIELFEKYELQFYVAGPAALRRTIDNRLKQQKESGKVSGASRSITNTHQRLSESAEARFNVTGELDLAQKRLLLVDKDLNVHEALIRLFNKNEGSLVIANDAAEVQAKLERDSFDFVWANRNLIGDEIEFEQKILKQNSSAELRLYDSLQVELFQESVPYRKINESLKTWANSLLKSVPAAIATQLSDFSRLAYRVATTLNDSDRIRDEVLYAALFWKWNTLGKSDSAAFELLDGILRIRRVFDCLQERFDGRGPLGLRGNQIPLASRVIAALSLVESIEPQWKTNWTKDKQEILSKKFDQFQSKQLDPIITSQILEILIPARDTDSIPLSKIAIIDSDEKFSKDLAAQLKRFGKPSIYADGLSALSGLKKEKPDLIVSEVLLSKLDGFSLCARLRADESLKNIPLVFLSESNAPEHSTKALQMGADDFISKDAEPQFILAKLEKLLSTRKKAG